MLIEAMPHGVSRLSAYRVLIKNIENIQVRRLTTGESEHDAKVAAEAGRLAVNHETQPYAFAHAAMSIIGSREPGLTDGVFCSQLIAKCYRLAGQSLVDHPDGRVTPNRLHGSHVLSDVSTITISTTADGAMRPIDGPGSTRDIAEFSKRLVGIVRSANKLLGVNGLEHVSDITALFRMFVEGADDPRIRAVDRQLSETLKNANLDSFLDQFWRLISEEDEDIQERTYRLILNRLISPDQAASEIPQLRHLVQHKRKVLAEYSVMRDSMRNLFESTGLVTFKSFHAFYDQLCLAYTTYGAPFEIALTALEEYVRNEA